MQPKHLWLVLVMIASSCSLVCAASLDVGARVRWISASEPREPRIGTVLSLSWDTLLVAGERDSSSEALALASLASLEMSVGRRNRSGQYALMGALSGGVLAVGGVYVMGSAVDQALKDLLGPSKTRPGTYFAAGAAGAGVGAVIGATIGAGCRAPERWVAVRRRDLRLGMAQGRPAVWLCVRF